MVGGPSEKKIRILIVEDFADVRENIRRVLEFESDFEVVGGARTGQEAIELARETQPDVILMDLNLPDMDGFTVTKTLTDEIRFTQVVVVSIQAESDYIRKAMLAGAKFYIPKPPPSDELIATVRDLGERAHQERQRVAAPVYVPAGPGPGMGFGGPQRPSGKAIAVYSAKGGVGVTTLATNLAIGLNTNETPTVLVDTSLQFGDVSVFLNLQVKNSIADLAGRADELDAEFVEEVVMVHESGLRVLAAPQRPEMADEIRAEQVRKVLQFLKRQFAYVVIDTSSTLDDTTLAVLDVADVLVAVATPDIPAIKDARLLFDLLTVLDFSHSNVLFVLNKMDRSTGITAEAVAENLKQTVGAIIPYDERTVTASINRGVPLLLGDKSRPPARGILDLIGVVKQKLVTQSKEQVEEREREAERPRMFSR